MYIINMNRQHYLDLYILLNAWMLNRSPYDIEYLSNTYNNPNPKDQIQILWRQQAPIYIYIYIYIKESKDSRKKRKKESDWWQIDRSKLEELLVDNSSNYCWLRVWVYATQFSRVEWWFTPKSISLIITLDIWNEISHFSNQFYSK